MSLSGLIQDTLGKQCSRCKETKPASDFYPDRSGRRKDGLHCWCRPCTLEYNRAYIKRNPEENRERARRSRVKARYGITWQQRDQLIEEQDGKCAVCGDEFRNPKATHIDHCHDSGRVRGILCEGCNLGLGSFKDDPRRLLNAVAYLEKYKEDA